MAEIRHLENGHDVIFFCRRWSNLDKISETGAEWHVDCGDVVEIETRCRILITDVCANSMVYHPRATYHIAGCSHLTKSMSWSCHITGCKNSIRHIENRFSPYFIFFLFLMQFRLWRAAAFVSSPLHLFYWCCPSVRLSVCEQDSSRTRSQMSIKHGTYGQGVILWKYLNFVVDPNPGVDIQSFPHFPQH